MSYWDSDRKIAIGFLSNNTLASPLQPALARALARVAEGEVVAPLDVDFADEGVEADVGALVGDYVAEGVGAFRIDAAEGSAFLVMDGAPRLRLYPIGFNGLYAPGADVYLFVRPSTNALAWSTTFVETEARRR